MKNFVLNILVVLYPVCFFGGAFYQKHSTKDPVKEFARGRSEGFQFAVRKFVEDKMLLTPEVGDGACFDGCIFVKVELREGLVSVGSHSYLSNSLFLMDGVSGEKYDPWLHEAWDGIFNVGAYQQD